MKLSECFLFFFDFALPRQIPYMCQGIQEWTKENLWKTAF